MIYKILVNGKSCHGGKLSWPLPEGDAPGAWVEVEGDLALCGHGLHLTTKPALWLTPGCTVYEAEGGDCGDDDGDKFVYRRARLLRVAPWWEKVQNFVEEIRGVEWFSNAGELPANCRVYETWAATMNAAWDAAWDAARAAAWAAAMNAARAAAWDAARNAAWAATMNATMNAARAAAWDAARAAARNAAWAATMNAARAAAWDAARAAALQCAMTCIVDDLPLPEEHCRYAAESWSVWKAGYGVFGKDGDTWIIYKTL